MNVFIGMEESQVIQRAFEERGHNAWSCDLKPGRLNPSRHIQGDVHTMLPNFWSADGGWHPCTPSWDLIILHPACRLLSSSSQHWNGKPGQRTHAEVEQAVDDFMRCTRYEGRVCIENSIGIMSTRYRKPDQIVQPHQFGEDASKATCLWLQNLPKLIPTTAISPRWICPKCYGHSRFKVCGNMLCSGWNRQKCNPRWANQTDSGQNRLGPTKDPEDRRATRAVTYQGIADAMAEQWGSL